jgi:hypothetical protein
MTSGRNSPVGVRNAQENVMRSPLSAFCLPVLVAITVTSVAAHHDAYTYYDATKLVSISGPIVELRTVNPHAVLVIDGTAPDGRTGRWAFEGIPPNAYQHRGLKDYKARLMPGTRITISGWAAKDPQARAFSANLITFEDGSTMVFGGKTLEPSQWTCPSQRCVYAYPQVTQ